MRVKFIAADPGLNRRRARNAKISFPDGSAIYCGPGTIYSGCELSHDQSLAFKSTMAFAFVRAAMKDDPSITKVKPGAFSRGAALKPVEIAHQIARVLTDIDCEGSAPYGNDPADTLVIHAATPAQATDIAETIISISPRSKVTGAPIRPEPLSSHLKARFAAWLREQRKPGKIADIQMTVKQ